MGTQQTGAVMNKINKQKKVISFVFIALLMAQIFIFYAIANIGSTMETNSDHLDKIEAGITKTFISDTIRNQLRIMLASTRESWSQYLQTHPDTELLEKVDGKYVFTNDSGKSISFDPTAMKKVKSNGYYYNIYDLKTGAVLLENARPAWNKKGVEEILNIIATPIKAYGPSGIPTVYDVYTGEIIVGSGANIKSSDSSCLNQTAYKEFVEDDLLTRRDTDATSNLINLCYEPNIASQDAANDFDKYPLGKYNRQFVEKIILPYEAVTVDGQEMQIAITLSANEKEILNAYQGLLGGYSDIESTIQDKATESILYPIVSVGISLVVILFAMFMIRLLSYQCKVCSIGDKESDSQS